MAGVTISRSKVPIIRITGVTTDSTSTCAGATGGTSQGTATINGTLYYFKNQKPNRRLTIGSASITFNEQLPVLGADQGLTVNALHVKVPGVANIIISSATSDIHNCP